MRNNASLVGNLFEKKQRASEHPAQQNLVKQCGFFVGSVLFNTDTAEAVDQEPGYNSSCQQNNVGNGRTSGLLKIYYMHFVL